MLLYPGVLLCRKNVVDFKTFHLKMPSFGRHFCWDKYGRRCVYNWTFWVEIFWNQRIFFCIIERRDRVTFTCSIGTIFVGINVTNDDFSPEWRRPPPKSTIFGMGLSYSIIDSLCLWSSPRQSYGSNVWRLEPVLAPFKSLMLNIMRGYTLKEH